MRLQHLYVNPRGFRNEFSIYRVRPEDVPNAERWVERMTHQQYTNDNYAEIRWITKREADARTASERARARELIRAGQDLHVNPVGATEIEDWHEAFPEWE